MRELKCHYMFGGILCHGKRGQKRSGRWVENVEAGERILNNDNRRAPEKERGSFIYPKVKQFCEVSVIFKVPPMEI